jgi:hAT family C-terminal dimerisation region
MWSYTVPYLSSTGAHSDWGMVDAATLSLPHVWWNLHADGAPTLLRDLAAQVFSSVPTSASGERNFKQRSHVHTRIRNRLSDGKANMTQAILFNKHQKKRLKGLCYTPAAQRWRSRYCTLSLAGKRRLHL